MALSTHMCMQDLHKWCLMLTDSALPFESVFVPDTIFLGHWCLIIDTSVEQTVVSDFYSL